MATAAEVKVYFTGDTSNLEGATQKANGMFDGMLGGLTKFGAIAGVGALAAGAFGAAATMAAADVAESQNKVNVVFGESKGAIEELASTAAASLGQTRGQVLEAAGTFGNLLTALGMTKDGAADMSVDMVKLASDLASFNNSDPTEVLEALRSGLTGEAEPMKRFGVALNEVAMKQAAMKAGLGDNVAALSEAEKMQLRYNIIMEQTKTAQGDFANTSDGMANSLRIIKASVSDAVAQIGDRFLPLIQPLVSGFAQALPGALDMASGALDRVMGFFQPVIDIVGNVAGAIGEGRGIVGALREMGGGLDGILGNQSEQLFTFFGDIGFAIEDGVGKAQEFIGQFLEGFNLDPDMSFIEKIQNGFGELAAIFDDTKGGAGIANFFWGIVEGAQGLIDGFNDARPGIESFVGSMIDNFNTMKENIGPIIEDILPVVGEAIASLGDGFAIVAPILGDVMAVIGDLSSKLAEFLWPILQQVFGFINEHKELFVVLGATIAVIAGGPVTMLVGALVLIGAVWPAIVDGFNTFKDKLAEVGENVTAFIDGVTGKWEEIKADTAEAWDNVKQAVDDGIQGAYDAVESIGQAIQDRIGEAQDWIQEKINEVWNAIPEDIREDLELIAETIREKFDKFKSDIEMRLAAIVLIGEVKWAEFRAKVETALTVASAFIASTMETARQQLENIAGDLAAPFVAAFEQMKQAWETHVTPLIDRARQVFDGVRNSVRENIDKAVAAIREGLARGKAWAEQEAAKIRDAIMGPLRDAIAKVKGIAGDIINGLVGGLNAAKDKVRDTLLDMVRGGLEAVKSFLGVASPSKVYEEIGMWITLGLASGIQKEDQKAVAALAAVIQSMGAVLGGVQDFASKLLKFVVPSDTQLAEAKGKFIQMLVIIQNFAKDMSYLGSLVGPSTPNISFAAPGQIATINQGLAELASTLPAVKELQGLRAEDLLTGGEASWVTGLTDIIGKVASSWGSLADNLTKMSAAKMPSAETIQTLKEAAVRIIVWAQDVTKMAPPNPVGLDDFAQTVKSAADMLATVAKLNLGEIVALAESNLTTAASNADKLARAAVPLALAFAAAAGTGEQRADLVKAVSEYASVVKSSADILTSGATDKLAEATALDATRLDAAARNTTSMLTAVVGLALDFQKAAGTEAQGATLLTGVKLYADTVKAAGDALSAGAALALADATDVDLIQLDIATTNAAEMVKAVTLLSTAFRSMAEEAQAELASGTKLYAEVVKAAGDVLGAGGSLALAEATDVDLTQLDIAEANAALMFVSVKGLSETFRKLAEDARKDLADGAKQYADVIKAAADVLGLGAALDLRDAVAFEWNLLPFIEETVTAVYDVVVRLSEKFRQLGGEDQTNLASGAKLYADIIKAAADMLKAGASVDLKNAVTFEWNMLGFVEEAVAAMFDSIVRMAEKFTQDNNGTAQKAIVEGAKNFAATVTAAASLFGSVADAVAKLGELTNPGDLTAKLDIVRGWITIIWDQLKMIAVDITKDEAEAKAAVASAIGSAAKGLGDIGDGIGKLMSMATGGLFGADSKRGDIGFMQAVRGRRADFNASVLTDSIKRMVKALTDALSGLDLPSPDDPRVAAIAALGDAFGKLADGIDKLATVKIPDARRMAELMAIAAQGSLIPGAGLTVGAGGGGTTTINNYNTVNGGVTIVAPDQPSFTSLIAGLGAWRIR